MPPTSKGNYKRARWCIATRRLDTPPRARWVLASVCARSAHRLAARDRRGFTRKSCTSTGAHARYRLPAPVPVRTEQKIAPEQKIAHECVLRRQARRGPRLRAELGLAPKEELPAPAAIGAAMQLMGIEAKDGWPLPQALDAIVDALGLEFREKAPAAAAASSSSSPAAAAPAAAPAAVQPPATPLSLPPFRRRRPWAGRRSCPRWRAC